MKATIPPEVLRTLVMMARATGQSVDETVRLYSGQMEDEANGQKWTIHFPPDLNRQYLYAIDVTPFDSEKIVVKILEDNLPAFIEKHRETKATSAYAPQYD